MSSNKKFTYKELEDIGVNVCNKSDGEVSLVIKDIQVWDSVDAFGVINAALMKRNSLNNNNVGEAMKKGHTKYLQDLGKPQMQIPLFT